MNLELAPVDEKNFFDSLAKRVRPLLGIVRTRIKVDD